MERPQAASRNPFHDEDWKQTIWELPEAMRGSLVLEGNGLLGEEAADLRQSEVAHKEAALLPATRQCCGPPGLDTTRVDV